MKTLTIIVAAITGAATPLAASSGPETTAFNPLALLFMGFGALIVVCQLIPGLTLFLSMMKGLFRSTAGKPLSVPRDTEEIA
jgi:hypothetical protein